MDTKAMTTPNPSSAARERTQTAPDTAAAQARHAKSLVKAWLTRHDINLGEWPVRDLVTDIELALRIAAREPR